ncbi:MAG: esterase-like activity of phytase family protein [Planctomycetota bacterium]|nr:esterase-like activity of phytase family protein [Planctomycetota bacterium]
MPTRLSFLLLAACLLAACGPKPSSELAATPVFEGTHLRRIASFPAYLNGRVQDETVAEILSASADGRTLVYTDSESERLGFIDITDATNPRPAGTLDMGGEPTSVACRGGLALACVNRSEDYVETAGVLLVVDLDTHEVLRELDLGGQPDSIAVSPDGRFAAIAIENERDEGLGEGRLPQGPPGWLTIVDCVGEVGDWSLRRVQLTGLAELYPSDPEPEFVDINAANQVVVTLQENNHLVVVDLASGDVLLSTSSGAVDLEGVDVVADGRIALDGELTGVLREPDAVGWISATAFATANEGDLDGGSRGFTTWSASGEVLFDAGATVEHELVRLGHFPEDRADAKGGEPEGIEFGRFRMGGQDRDLVFVGCERGNVVLVYDVTADPARPELVQVLPTGVGPEGILAIPSRGLLAVAAERDDRKGGYRSSVTLYALADAPSYPSLVSEDDAAGLPIGWLELSGLAVDPSDDGRLFSVPDSGLRPSRIYTIDATASPARIVHETLLHDSAGVLAATYARLAAQLPADFREDFAAGLAKAAGGRTDGTVDLDLEGVCALADGTFWVVAEGSGRGPLHPKAKGKGFRPNLLLHVAADGELLRAEALPEVLVQAQEGAGLEGVASDGELVYAVLQRPWGEANGLLRRTVLLRFEPATGTWASAYYTLDEVASPAGGWVGVSGLQLMGGDRLAVLERDNQGGEDARIKRLYSVALEDLDWSTSGDHDSIQGVRKSLLLDLVAEGVFDERAIPVPVFLEGLALDSSGSLLLLNDNGGVAGNGGETHLIRLRGVLER